VPESFDTVIVGTGFASTFFLQEHLKHAAADERILVLERGRKYDYAWRAQNRRNSDFDFFGAIVNRTPDKPWIQNVAFGGGSCWTGNTPRMHPNDFKTQTLYGVGMDWPFDYGEIEPYFLEVERLMGIGGNDEGPFPRSAPYPAPPHKLNALDRVIAEKYPGHMIPMPTARSSHPSTGRAVCCVNNICGLCPVSAKFQVDMHMTTPYDDPRVTLRLDSEVYAMDVTGDRVRAVMYRTADGQERQAGCDLAVLGAHAIWNPYIMMRSGITGQALGKFLNEQWGIGIQLDLDGVDSFDGSTTVSAMGTMFMDGDFRKERPACLIESWNAPWLRAEPGRWRQRGYLKLVYEDIPSAESTVEVSKDDVNKPAVRYAPMTPYAQAGARHAPKLVEELLSGLPIEDYLIEDLEDKENRGSAAHIQGTTRMGRDPATSVVDADQRHHQVRNLVVVGSGVFPTCMAANPTMPLSALAIRAARRMHQSTSA